MYQEHYEDVYAHRRAGGTRVSNSPEGYKHHIISEVHTIFYILLTFLNNLNERSESLILRSTFRCGI